MAGTKAFAGLMALAVAWGCGCARAPHILVGSKNFTEQVLLGEIVAQQIERRLDVTVERRLNLGGTLLAHEALVKGDIDLYPEYTGTALTAVLKQPPASGAEAVLEQVRREYRRRWRLEWLRPLGFNDAFAMMVRGETARTRHLATLSEAARAGRWNMGIGYEFAGRPDGLEGLLGTYGLRTVGPPLTMDLGLLYQALESRKVDLIAGNRTDGMASVLDVTILEDDRHYFPPYECAVVAREDALARWPAMRGAIEELSGGISEAAMRKLNYAVDGKHRPVAEVAAEFLSR
jgi:osmoprotectant transport system substrate-binding protein